MDKESTNVDRLFQNAMYMSSQQISWEILEEGVGKVKHEVRRMASLASGEVIEDEVCLR